MENQSIMEGSWLNLNRACNLRCKWCYASGTGFSSKDDMSLKLAKELIDLRNSGKNSLLLSVLGHTGMNCHELTIT